MPEHQPEDLIPRTCRPLASIDVARRPFHAWTKLGRSCQEGELEINDRYDQLRLIMFSSSTLLIERGEPDRERRRRNMTVQYCRVENSMEPTCCFPGR